jgi:xanthine/CO dehydrogenase XdhC/CoxF family maturation factor
VTIAKPRGLSENGRMIDIERILPLGRELEAAGADYVLGTVVAVEGASYRKPGALMLLAPDGRRAGTVSGGCLEAQVASRAWWLTANGPCVQRYSTAEEDGERPYGSGCGGVVSLLLERRATASPLLAALQQAFDRRAPLAVATIVEGGQIGRRALAGLEGDPAEGIQAGGDPLQELAEQALASRKSIEKEILAGGIDGRVWVDFRPARPGLWIFGAGDDAQPLLHLAKELGWFVSVADGRSHLATRERFPLADEVRVLPIGELPAIQSGSKSASQPVSQPASQPVGSASPLGNLLLQDAAAVMSHSFELDARVLAALLALDAPPAYIGVLGTQRRTRELLAEAAHLLSLPADPASAAAAQVERWLAQLHSPMGLDLGAESPETIAFSVLAEIQKTLAGATALPLREVRGGMPAIFSS